NVIEVSFATPPANWDRVLAALPGAESVSGQHDLFRIASGNGPVTTTALMETATRAGVAVLSLSVQSTSLDDVFVHYTGPAVRELCNAVAGGSRTFETIEYSDQGTALADLRNGGINGVLIIPPEFSRLQLEKAAPRLALIEDNTDNFVAATLAASVSGMIAAL